MTDNAATGSLVGLALGDALGSSTEFISVPEILGRYGPWRELGLPEPARVTDDTQMTLALGKGLRTALASGPLDAGTMEQPVRDEFVAWNRSPENNRAPGTTCLTACGLLAAGELAWQDASRINSKAAGPTCASPPSDSSPV